MDKNVLFKGVTDQGIFCRPLFTPFEKSASVLDPDSWETAPEIKRVISSITPRQREENAYVLVNAMGAGEYFGSNINADFFEWNMLAHEGEDYGYKTFLNAHCFTHHCFPSGTKVLLPNRDRVGIETIKVGDKVQTLSGPRAVTKVMRRPYVGQGVSIKVHGNYRPLVSTYDHPIYVYRRESIHCPHKYNLLGKSKTFCHAPECKDLRGKIGSPEWAPASTIRVGDYLVVPKPSHGSTSVPPEFAELVGWVASEGHIGKRGSIQFTFSSKNTKDINKVTACLKNNGLNVGITDLPMYGTVLLSSCSSGMCKRLREYVVGTKDKKTLSGRVLEWDRESLLTLLGSYIDGDGHVPVSGSNKGQLRIRSSSPQMLYMLGDIIRSLGVPATVQWDSAPKDLVSPTNKKTYRSSGSGVVSVASSFASKISVYSRKHSPKFTKKDVHILLVEDGFLLPVRSIEESYLSEDVFNLEVDEVHHYIAEESVVHNCNKDPTKAIGKPIASMLNSRMKRVELVIEVNRAKAKIEGADGIITRVDNGEFPDVSMGTRVPYDICSICGNKSKTRDDYCEHMRPTSEYVGIYGPNKILPDGRKIFVYNPYPRFFDISFVFIGADKTAKVMTKLAKVGSQVCLGPVCSIDSNPQNETQHTTSAPAEPKDYSVQIEKSASKDGPECGGPCSCGGVCGSGSEKEGREKLAYKYPIKTSAHRKLSEIIKQVPAGSFSVRKLPSLEGSEPDIPSKALDYLSDLPLGTVSSGMSGLGMVMKPREFQRIVLMRMGEEDLADAFDRGGIGFRRDLPPSPMFPEDDIGSSAKSILPLLSSILPHRTAFGGPMRVRITIIKSHNPIPTPEEVKHPLLDKIGSAYSAYRVSSLEKIARAARVVESDYQLREAVLGETLNSMFKNASYDRVVDPDSVTYLMGAYLQDRGLSNVAALSEKAAAQTLELLGLSG